MMTVTSTFLANETETELFGQCLAKATQGKGLITLSGDLGTGKTTLSRGLIRAFGHKGPVKSPTYTLVEPYEIAKIRVMHFDLYRMEDPEELEFMGFRDYIDDETLCLIEWPEKAKTALPTPDLTLTLSAQDHGRLIRWQASTEYGKILAKELSRRYSKKLFDTFNKLEKY